MAEYQKDLTIYPFLDRMTFSMPENYIDWETIDQLDSSDPSSREYRKLMREIGITGRLNTKKPRSFNRYGTWD